MQEKAPKKGKAEKAVEAKACLSSCMHNWSGQYMTAQHACILHFISLLPHTLTMQAYRQAANYNRYESVLTA